MPDDIAAAGSSPAPSTAPVITDMGVKVSAPLATEGAPVDAGTQLAQPQGPIPFDRHKSILDGAYSERDTARRELEEFRQRYQWAEQVDPTEFQQLQRWSQGYNTDPVRWMAETIGELRQMYPHLTPALTSEAARILAGSRDFSQEAEIEPDIPVLDAQGQVVSQAYSADKVKTLIQRAVTEAVGPMKQSLATREAQEQARAIHDEAVQVADTLYTRAQQWHGFNDHKSAILKAMEQHPDWQLHDAYLHVLHTEILPNADQKSQTKLLNHLQIQAAGATVHPGTTTSSTLPKFNSHKEAAIYYDAHPEEAKAMADR